MLNIYLNQSACNYFQTKYSIVCNFKSIIARCEHKQSVIHLTSSELESLISHEIQKLYDTIVDSVDFNQLFNGHGHDWIRNGHKKRIISCYEYSFHIDIQRIYSKELNESHMVYISLLLPFIRLSTEAVIDTLKQGDQLPAALKTLLSLFNNLFNTIKQSSSTMIPLALIKSLYKILVSRKKRQFKVFFSVLYMYQHAYDHSVLKNSLLCLKERKRWCKYEQIK